MTKILSPCVLSLRFLWHMLVVSLWWLILRRSKSRGWGVWMWQWAAPWIFSEVTWLTQTSWLGMLCKILLQFKLFLNFTSLVQVFWIIADGVMFKCYISTLKSFYLDPRVVSPPILWDILLNILTLVALASNCSIYVLVGSSE